MRWPSFSRIIEDLQSVWATKGCVGACRSLRRLGFDAIDLFQLHAVPAEGEETEQALDTLEALRREGVAKE